MTVTLDDRYEEIIQRQIESGHFANSNEVVAHALRLLRAEGDEIDAEKQALNERLERSMAQGDRGETYSPEEARQILARRRALRAG